jgi:zinc-ribbon domain
MFCPKCGAVQSDEMKFCKACGANLQAVRQVVEAGGAGDKFDWSKSWVAEMFLSGQEAVKRATEIERLQGITPEVKRYNEIKGGVITSCVGIALIIFLAVFMQGIVVGGKVPQDTAEILSRLWVAGVIPLMVGVGLIINGMFVSKKQAAIIERERQRGQGILAEATAERQALRAGDTAEIIPPGFSVTEGTTKHLSVAAQKVRDPNNT